MLEVFNNIMRYFMNLFKRPVIKDEEWQEADGRREENFEGEPPESNDPLWYSGRTILPELDKVELKTRGKYKAKYPEGAVIHYTAGRSGDQDARGRSSQELAVEQIKHTAENGMYCYFLIDADGQVYQNFPLDEWGYHAGKSTWQSIEGSVSNEFVGIEVMCAGRVNKIDDKKFRAWFTVTEKGDKYYSDIAVRYSDRNENIKRGFYHRFTSAQEVGLRELLYWLFDNGDGVFKIKNIVGHDEVAPERKDDPGASLSTTMKQFRREMVDKKIEDKDITEKDLLNVL